MVLGYAVCLVSSAYDFTDVIRLQSADSLRQRVSDHPTTLLMRVLESDGLIPLLVAAELRMVFDRRRAVKQGRTDLKLLIRLMKG